ncbi:hypothetical protein [Pseudonocardia sp.]|uniref:hypothetical protein n=1 Tax=Pseudonocardia sp. TaxID=60912 RepID=UPI003D0B95D1
MTSRDDSPVRLCDAPTVAAAVEGLMAVPTCSRTGCDDETVPFTDLCDHHLRGEDT